MVKRAAKEREATRVELDAPSRITKMDDPYMVKRDGMGLKAAGGAALAGFLLGALGIAFLEFRSRRVSDLSEVSRGLSLPIMGTLPLVRVRAPVKNAQSGHASDASDQESMIESVDAARTVLLQAFRKKNLRVVMITSAGAGEGKTLLSAHLAISLARAGWRMLLIDGDLRRPTLHKVFGLENAVGLGEILRGEAIIGDVVRQATGELSMISAGHGDQRSLRGLAQGELGRLFDEAKKNYDFVILDSAPVLPVADAQLMAQAVDGVILSVLQNVSRLPFVYAAYERLMLLQANLLGVVLHGESFGAYGSHYTYQSLEGGKTAPGKANG
jgi:capsular exopolysaccharide synthesis family protein